MTNDTITTAGDLLPQLERIGTVAKRLGMTPDALRKNLPETALYRVSRNWLVDVDAVKEWLDSRRMNAPQSALRRDFARQVGRRSSALRRDFGNGRANG